MMSAGRNVRNLAEALDSGANGFTEEPLRAEELHARLRAAERLTTIKSEPIRLAETDPLTGFLNRRAFLRQVEAAAERVGPYGVLSAILVDIDNGLDVGDTAIRAVSELIGKEGIVGRLGGEAFAIALPGRSLMEASVYANRLRLRVTDLCMASTSNPVRLSCSFGVSEWAGAESVERLLKRADLALDEAKTSGRNRVVSAASDLILAHAC